VTGTTPHSLVMTRSMDSVPPRDFGHSRVPGASSRLGPAALQLAGAGAAAADALGSAGVAAAGLGVAVAGAAGTGAGGGDSPAAGAPQAAMSGRKKFGSSSDRVIAIAFWYTRQGASSTAAARAFDQSEWCRAGQLVSLPSGCFAGGWLAAPHAEAHAARAITSWRIRRTAMGLATMAAWRWPTPLDRLTGSARATGTRHRTLRCPT
jgi:hypothetical protein